MTILIISLILLGAVAAVTGIVSQRRNGSEEIVQPEASCATCTGENPRCEQECMLEAAVKDVEYFNDEELDTFKGRSSDEYTDSEAEMFAEVMYTMRRDEVAEWNRSLILRDINIPDQVKDELIMMMEK